MHKKHVVLLILLAFVLGGLVAGAVIMVVETDADRIAEKVSDNRTCVVRDSIENLDAPEGALPLSVQEALHTALQDEYSNRASYLAILERYGDVRPFNTIIVSEERHIAILGAIYDRYGLEMPPMEPTEVVVGDTLSEACQLAVEEEVANTAMYDEILLAVEGYEEIEYAFENLSRASRDHHKRAFEKCAL